MLSSPSLCGCPHLLSSAHATRPTPPTRAIARQCRRCSPFPDLWGRLHLLSPAPAACLAPLTSVISHQRR
jgi:hypothetical protein